MTSKYCIEVSFTPICTSCGKELEISMTKSELTNYPAPMDNPYERKDRIVYVRACVDCYIHKNRVQS